MPRNFADAGRWFKTGCRRNASSRLFWWSVGRSGTLRRQPKHLQANSSVSANRYSGVSELIVRGCGSPEPRRQVITRKWGFFETTSAVA